MILRDYILSEKNIYLAIYAAKSYVFDPQLLSREDKELLNSLMDPFNEELLCGVIKEVREIVEKIIDDCNYFFETQVYYKPKEYNAGERIYRPIHTAELKQLIAMVAVMHPLIYEIAIPEDNWKLTLSNYSRLIPNNFYGNRVSKKPEELFKKWNEQYKRYTQKANEYFKTFHESKEYKYELKLDLKNFFPSVDPMVIYGIMLEHIPVTINALEDILVFKRIIYKLLICKVTNLSSVMAIEKYYGMRELDMHFTKGIPQGLPQSYFFGNICMIKISEVFDKVYGGKSVYYVDDSYIYTNKEISSNEHFKEQLEHVNVEINEIAQGYIEKAQSDKVISENKVFYEFGQVLNKNIDNPYCINVHTEGKSTYSEIPKSKEGEIYLRTLSREASQIGADISSAYSEEEDEAMLHRTEALLHSIEIEKNSVENDTTGYKEKLERYYKFFKYREIKLRLKIEKNISANVFKVLLGDNDLDDKKDLYYVLANNKISTEDFFKNYKHDIWQVAISMLITNTVYEHNTIRTYLKNVIKDAYSDEMLECSYIQRLYNDYLNDDEVRNSPDKYATLNKQTNRKLLRYSNMNFNILKEKIDGVKIQGLNEDILSSFGICSQNFIDMSIVVNMNSNRLRRMFLNSIYSKVFKVVLSDDVVLSSYDKKGITYGELRTLVYLRNTKCDVETFFKMQMEIMSPENLQNVDYTVFEVLGAFKRYVITPENIDNLIMVHKYTCDVWRNGAKHLYFYTLHNQEHAVDLIKNIIKIVKVFSYLKISNYDYYILFIACYLHDISMVRIASENDFLLDKDKSEIITTKLDKTWSGERNSYQSKKAIIDTYKAVDEFFEDKIRSKHAKDSAKEIRKRGELGFLEASVRENVAQIAEGHMMDAKEIYYTKGDAKDKLISMKFDKILLRIADLLDMSEHRVSKPILNHNIDNMSLLSAFHWVSHLLTEGYSLVSEYKTENKGDVNSNLTPGSITETVILSIYVNLSQFSKMKSKKCKNGRIDDNTLCSNGFAIDLISDNEICMSDNCNFLCRWFNNKNNFLVQEMSELQAYLSRVPVIERFYNTNILIKIVVKNPTDISDEQFEILKKKICDDVPT